MDEVKEFKHLGTVLGKHGGMEGEMSESCERQMCHKVTCKDCERKECIYGGTEMVKEQYSPANTDVWMRDLDME